MSGEHGGEVPRWCIAFDAQSTHEHAIVHFISRKPHSHSFAHPVIHEELSRGHETVVPKLNRFQTPAYIKKRESEENPNGVGRETEMGAS